MIIKKLKSKIHRAHLTKVDIEYEGSISIDKDLMVAAGLEAFESIHVWNVSTGARLETYVIEGEAGTGEIGLNGAAARGASTGDIVILASWCWHEPDEKHEPIVVLVDEKNRIKS